MSATPGTPRLTKGVFSRRSVWGVKGSGGPLNTNFLNSVSAPPPLRNTGPSAALSLNPFVRHSSRRDGQPCAEVRCPSGVSPTSLRPTKLSARALRCCYLLAAACVRAGRVGSLPPRRVRLSPPRKLRPSSPLLSRRWLASPWPPLVCVAELIDLLGGTVLPPRTIPPRSVRPVAPLGSRRRHRRGVWKREELPPGYVVPRRMPPPLVLRIGRLALFFRTSFSSPRNRDRCVGQPSSPRGRGSLIG